MPNSSGKKIDKARAQYLWENTSVAERTANSIAVEAGCSRPYLQRLAKSAKWGPRPEVGKGALKALRGEKSLDELTGTAELEAQLGLTPQEREFCHAYVRHGPRNLKEAAEEAGYEPYYGRHLIQRKEIRYLIEKITEARAARHELKADDIIRGFKEIAEATIGDVAAWTGNALTIKDSVKLPRAVIAAIKSIEQKKDGSIKIVMHDKVVALQQLGRVLGMFTDNVNVNQSDIDEFRKIVEVSEQKTRDFFKSLPGGGILDLTPEVIRNGDPVPAAPPPAEGGSE